MHIHEFGHLEQIWEKFLELFFPLLLGQVFPVAWHLSWVQSVDNWKITVADSSFASDILDTLPDIDLVVLLSEMVTEVHAHNFLSLLGEGLGVDWGKLGLKSFGCFSGVIVQNLSGWLVEGPFFRDWVQDLNNHLVGSGHEVMDEQGFGLLDPSSGVSQSQYFDGIFLRRWELELPVFVQLPLNFLFDCT